MAEDKRLKQNEVIVPYNALNLRIQEIIGKKGSLGIYDESIVHSQPEFFSNQLAIRHLRKVRGFTEGNAAIGLLTGMPEGIAGAFLHWGARMVTVKYIRKSYEDILDVMNKFGVLQTKIEASFPKDWINPTKISQTHPIFFVDGKGNIHFLKDGSRLEYARHIFQKTRAGKLGFGFWRWRGYLSPPKAPEKAKDWAKRKVSEWAAKAKRRPKMMPAPANYSSFSKKPGNSIPKPKPRIPRTR